MAKARTSDGEEWPPPSGRDFIRSDDFGRMVLRWCEELSRRYPQMNFSDAAGHVFAWFDGKLSKNRRFINAGRFRTRQSFIAYLRQCVWNAARLAERQRRRRDEVEMLAADEPMAVDRGLGPEEVAELREAIDNLGYPRSEIVLRIIFDEESVEAIASDLNLNPQEVQEFYAEAIDLLGDELR